MNVIIDPGHGGSDPGASAFGVTEKEWNLIVSLYQFKRFKELGVQVELTRHSDLTLDPVTRIAKVKNKADLCLSNHFNAFNGKARGIEVIHSIHARSTLSDRIASHLVSETGLPLRRVFTRQIAQNKDYYYMHRLTGKTKTVIIEYGFLDNVEDFAYFSKETHLYKAAEAVVKAVCLSLEIPYSHGVSAKITDTAPAGNVTSEPSVHSTPKQRLVSIHEGNLRFYSKASWADQDVYGYMRKGQLFTTVIDKVAVGNGEQYIVKNKNDEVYYVTAHPAFVKIV
ncbi:MAG: N-acetylmuramoyl-L-alanine amidase [Alkalibacterium sp.]|nr:N-acetylmuramoyl-L-alanine amidase [Alkalibacterium sp.]